jgi:ComF family protein
VDHLVSGLKFNGRLADGRLLAALLGEHLEAAKVPLPDLLIPVPLHRERLRERGFNQALELARPLGRRFDIPLDLHSIRRQRETAPQSGLERKARRRNLKGAFILTRELEAKHVALVDDVVTTGSTVSELARMLKRGGVQRVDIWALARTPF